LGLLPAAAICLGLEIKVGMTAPYLSLFATKRQNPQALQTERPGSGTNHAHHIDRRHEAKPPNPVQLSQPAGYDERITRRFEQLAQSLGLVYSPEELKRLDTIAGRLALLVCIAAAIADDIQFWLHR
jgi:hypothetical protein